MEPSTNKWDDDLEGFSLPPKDASSELGKASKRLIGFERLGLKPEVLKGIKKKGYNVPTPIQRKTIPVVMSGRDVVAMARTGSGKTACFLLPLFEKLNMRVDTKGIRALILSPTRELAVQTLKFTRELGKFTGLKSTIILGGDSMDNQFTAIHGNPDIVVATPGRFLHICVEMNLKLDSVQYVVFDEADRLFELGFGIQMNEILARLPDNRQTLLFSATLPKLLVDFARAGLSEPVLLRLDVESKLPDLLKLVFLKCRDIDKYAALLVLLKNVICDEQSVIFAATKHHVEYISMLLDKAEISNTIVYSDLDPSARKINIAKFEKKKAQVLVVTDVAARGIDLPHLDNVINFNFPAKPKLFVHRVGRCARAGRSGTAYTLLTIEELPYFLDLHLFLGRAVNIAKRTIVVKKEQEEYSNGTENDVGDGALGTIPQILLEEEQANLNRFWDMCADLRKQKSVSERGYERYLETRPSASQESIHRLKDYDFIDGVGPHPLFDNYRAAPLEEDKAVLLGQMKQYRPPLNIFELNKTSKTLDHETMIKKRRAHRDNISRHYQRIAERSKNSTPAPAPSAPSLPSSSQEDIEEAFKTIIKGSRHRDYDPEAAKRKKLKRAMRDQEHYVPYNSEDRYTEEGLTVNFEKDARSAALDLTGDSADMMRTQKNQKVWDRKRKKMVQINPDKKVAFVKSESGQKIPATYRSKRYDKWVERNKVEEQLQEDSDEDEEAAERRLQPLTVHPHTHWGRHNAKMERKKVGVGLKTTEHLAKMRLRKENEAKRIKKKREMRRGKPSGPSKTAMKRKITRMKQLGIH